MKILVILQTGYVGASFKDAAMWRVCIASVVDELHAIVDHEWRNTAAESRSTRTEMWPSYTVATTGPARTGLESHANFYGDCILSYWHLSGVRKIAKIRILLSSSRLSVRPSVRMEQLGSNWKDFREIWYLGIFRKSFEKIQVSLKSDKNNWYFAWRAMYIYGHFSLSSS